jgi:hypothetical protein
LIFDTNTHEFCSLSQIEWVFRPVEWNTWRSTAGCNNLISQWISFLANTNWFNSSKIMLKWNFVQSLRVGFSLGHEFWSWHNLFLKFWTYVFTVMPFYKKECHRWPLWPICTPICFVLQNQIWHSWQKFTPCYRSDSDVVSILDWTSK